MVDQMTKWVRHNASTILTCVGAGGMIATVVSAVKATPKAHIALVSAKTDKAIETMPPIGSLPKLTIRETIQACWRDYVPTAILGVSTLTCFFAANALNLRQQAMLMSAYAALDSAFQNYRGKVNDIFGEGADAIVIREAEREQAYKEDNDTPPWDEVQTFYLEGYPKFFERTMEQVKDAEYHINRNLILRGYATFNEFLSFLGLDGVECGDRIGWNLYDGECFYGYQWIDFNHKHRVTDGLLVCDIEMPFMPHPDEEPRMEDDYNGPEVPPAKKTDAIMKGGESHEEV